MVKSEKNIVVGCDFVYLRGTVMYKEMLPNFKGRCKVKTFKDQLFKQAPLDLISCIMKNSLLLSVLALLLGLLGARVDLIEYNVRLIFLQRSH